MSDKTILHYVYDPLCGWCYGAELLVRAAKGAGMNITLHGGGLWETPLRPDTATRKYLRENDGRIAALSGQPFGEAYLEGLLRDPATIFWSEPTVAAVLAATTVEPGSGLDMIAAIQYAHYVQGERVVEENSLSEAAKSIGVDEQDFRRVLKGMPVQAHIAETRRFMQKLRLGGYPGFVLERKGTYVVIDHQAHYGNPEAFVVSLQTA
ncbi:DsbA family protein [Modicisalibacter radicis]|uniref:DsbA family protein n=1 Tax=Halomonas sp. EAR18 TaxID=2518972 RepID=UPI00109D61D7|nr:DsbA family protein [Halomonas sp. EAR18]